MCVCVCVCVCACVWWLLVLTVRWKERVGVDLARDVHWLDTTGHVTHGYLACENVQLL